MARKNGKDRGLFERPKGSDIWWIRFHDHRGSEKRLKIGRKSLAEKAYHQRKELVRQIKLGLLPASALEGKTVPTLSEYLESIWPELEKKKSWRDEKRFTKRWRQMIGHLNLDEIGPVHLVKRRTALLAKGKRPATINRESAFMKATLARAVRDGVLDSNPLSGFKLLPENNEHDKYLTEPQEARLAKVMPPEDFEILAVAVDSGLRQGEQFSLTWPQINFDDNWIIIQEAKGEKGRSVPMTERVRDILLRRYETRTSFFVFPNPAGDKSRSARSFYIEVYLPALETAEVPHLTWHQAGRHTCGTRLAQRGAPQGVIEAILGHRSNKVSAGTFTTTRRACSPSLVCSTRSPAKAACPSPSS